MTRHSLTTIITWPIAVALGALLMLGWKDYVPGSFFNPPLTFDWELVEASVEGQDSVLVDVGNSSCTFLSQDIGARAFQEDLAVPMVGSIARSAAQTDGEYGLGVAAPQYRFGSLNLRFTTPRAHTPPVITFFNMRPVSVDLGFHNKVWLEGGVLLAYYVFPYCVVREGDVEGLKERLLHLGWADRTLSLAIMAEWNAYLGVPIEMHYPLYYAMQIAEECSRGVNDKCGGLVEMLAMPRED